MLAESIASQVQGYSVSEINAMAAAVQDAANRGETISLAQAADIATASPFGSLSLMGLAEAPEAPEAPEVSAPNFGYTSLDNALGPTALGAFGLGGPTGVSSSPFGSLSMAGLTEGAPEAASNPFGSLDPGFIGGIPSSQNLSGAPEAGAPEAAAPEAGAAPQGSLSEYQSAFAPDRSAPSWESFPEFNNFSTNPFGTLAYTGVPELSAPSAPQSSLSDYLGGPTYSTSTSAPSAPSAPTTSQSPTSESPAEPATTPGYFSSLSNAVTGLPGYFSGLSDTVTGLPGAVGSYFGSLSQAAPPSFSDNDGGGLTSAQPSEGSLSGSPAAPSLNLSSLYNLSDFLTTMPTATTVAPYSGLSDASVPTVAPPSFR